MSDLLTLIQRGAEVAAAVFAAFPVVPLVAICYLAGGMVAYTLMQTVKMYRREKKARKLTRSEIRVGAWIIAAHATFAMAVLFFDAPFWEAVGHGALSGILCPWVTAAFIDRWEKCNPELAESMKISRRRATDNPDDTGEFRL